MRSRTRRCCASKWLCGYGRGMGRGRIFSRQGPRIPLTCGRESKIILFQPTHRLGILRASSVHALPAIRRHIDRYVSGLRQPMEQTSISRPRLQTSSFHGHPYNILDAFQRLHPSFHLQQRHDVGPVSAARGRPGHPLRCRIHGGPVFPDEVRLHFRREHSVRFARWNDASRMASDLHLSSGSILEYVAILRSWSLRFLARLLIHAHRDAYILILAKNLGQFGLFRFHLAVARVILGIPLLGWDELCGSHFGKCC